MKKELVIFMKLFSHKSQKKKKMLMIVFMVPRSQELQMIS